MTLRATPLNLTRTRADDLTPGRLTSLYRAAYEFSKSALVPYADFGGIIRWMDNIICYRTDDTLWSVFDGDLLKIYFITTPLIQVDGRRTVMVSHGYGTPDISSDFKRECLNRITKMAFDEGAAAVQFITYRYKDAFQKWLPEGWKATGTLFEVRR